MDNGKVVQPVVVTDINMPFWSLVVLMVKLAVAAIPAMVILGVVAGVVSSVFYRLLTLTG
ncbi:hypothetical protein JCM14076_32530 [Methylosoma difficile]